MKKYIVERNLCLETTRMDETKSEDKFGTLICLLIWLPVLKVQKRIIPTLTI
jgi:hypothetical protein